MTVEELQQQVLDLQEQLKDKDGQIDKLTSEGKEKDERILSLQEHNQKLFLRLQVDDNDPEEKKEEPQATPEEVANKYRGVIR